MPAPGQLVLEGVDETENGFVAKFWEEVTQAGGSR
jgi:hypothetical protein